VITFPDKTTMAYTGSKMLSEWVERAEQEYADDEKKTVDKIITQTSSVIDVEACWSGGKAPRIDLVFLEHDSTRRPRIVFVEVKRAADPRMPQSPASAERKKTLSQLETYGQFLSIPANQEQVKRAYSNTSKDTATLLTLSDRGELARTLNANDLEVDPIPRLAIEWPDRSSSRRLSPEKLREKFGIYPIAILDEEHGYSLETTRWLRP
jgi:hypothetical protein